MHTSSLLVALVWFVSYAACHGGSFAAELAHRREFLEKRGSRLLQARDQCERGMPDDWEPYEQIARDLRAKDDLTDRALSDYNHTHHTSDKYTINTDPHEIFQKYKTCALAPDVTEGPFYVEGEFVRSKIVDDQAGVPLHLKVRVKDFATCDDVRDVFVEVWHANATGTYSGTGSEHGKTYLRGFQKTDNLGVVSFDTIFPGHYYQRATHIHVAVHVNAQQLSDGSVHDHTVSMNAQIFFDQELIMAVEQQSPYTKNTQELMYNVEDFFLGQEAAAKFDPFVDWVTLSDRVEDGILAWITVGANMTEHRDLSVADHRP